MGYQALLSNIDGNSNTAVGFQALFSNTDGDENSALGFQALDQNTTGFRNNAFGLLRRWRTTSAAISTTRLVVSHCNSDTGGQYNCAFGNAALINSTGDANTAAGILRRSRSHHWQWQCLYRLSCSGLASENNHTYIRNINSTSVSGGGTDTVTINLSTGLLGHLSSSRRYKENIKAIGDASEALYRLKPVSYRYKKEIDSTQSPAFGLIAEEVADVNAALVARNSNGEPESVHYEMVNAMLLNEFLKEHATVEELKKQIVELTAIVKQQTVQIQKVSARLEMTGQEQSWLPTISLNLLKRRRRIVQRSDLCTASGLRPSKF